MELNIKDINKLPVRTFRWLGVNELDIKEDIPDIKPYHKSPFGEGGIPEQLKDHNQKKDSFLFGEIKNTGMGMNAVNFVVENKNSCTFLHIPQGIKLKEPIYMDFNIDTDNPTLVDYNHIIAEEDSEVTIVINYSGDGGCPIFHSGLTFLQVGKGAVINLIQVQLLNNTAIHLNNVGVELSEDSKVNVIQCELGGDKTISGISANLVGDDTQIDVNTIYLGDKNRSFDFNYIMNHFGKGSQSDMNINGALMDQGSKTFRGTIDFKKGASGSVGQENENTLLFSPHIKNLSAPLILCGEDNVEGKHSANCGKIDEEQLFYMMSRGLDELTAKRMMIEAWFEPVINRIPYEKLQENVWVYVKERLNHVETI